MYRKHPIFTDQIYHVFNRSVASLPIFNENRDYERMCEEIDFYRFTEPGVRFSHYNRLDTEKRNAYLEKLHKDGKKQVLIYSFCLIPNHFHLVLKETEEKGIQRFIGNIQNSYAKYFNIKNKRSGSLFQEMFKAIRIETDEYFLQVIRYVHINPYSSFVVRKIEDLANYRWSSLGEYLAGKNYLDFIDKDFLNSFYSSPEKLREFTYDQADYQKKLKEIEHFIKEK